MPEAKTSGSETDTINTIQLTGRFQCAINAALTSAMGLNWQQLFLLSATKNRNLTGKIKADSQWINIVY